MKKISHSHLCKQEIFSSHVDIHDLSDDQSRDNHEDKGDTQNRFAPPHFKECIEVVWIHGKEIAADEEGNGRKGPFRIQRRMIAGNYDSIRSKAGEYIFT